MKGQSRHSAADPLLPRLKTELLHLRRQRAEKAPMEKQPERRPLLKTGADSSHRTTASISQT